MKGFSSTTAVCGVCFLASIGCWDDRTHYSDLVDPCYPERYNHMAKQAVNDGMLPQLQNGHILDQTVWNSHFETGKDTLTPGGLPGFGKQDGSLSFWQYSRIWCAVLSCGKYKKCTQ